MNQPERIDKMATLGNYRRIFKQDYTPDNQEDIDTLSITLNDSFEDIYDAFNHNITFQDNITCTIVTFTTSVSSTFAPTAPIVLKLSSTQKTVIGIIPISAVASDKNTLPNGGLYLDYTINNNTTSSTNTTNTGNAANSPFTININFIKGLPPSVPFTITAIII